MNTVANKLEFLNDILHKNINENVGDTQTNIPIKTLLSEVDCSNQHIDNSPS